MSVLQQQVLPAGTWTIDDVHSSAGFSVKHMVVATYRGSFSEIDASLRDGVLEGAVKVASIDARDENLKAHLLSPEFFDAENTPEVTFRSTDVRRDGDRLAIEGDLTVKGHTERVVARASLAGPTEDPYGNTKLGLDLEAVIDRTAFGLDWNAPLPKGGFALGNDVILTVHLELRQEA
jgi:polyisoprenoid-binding protein YceI